MHRWPFFLASLFGCGVIGSVWFATYVALRLPQYSGAVVIAALFTLDAMMISLLLAQFDGERSANRAIKRGIDEIHN